MRTWITHLPFAATLGVIAALLVHGPIAQLPHYHEFADQTVRFGLPNGCDVASNIGFALVAVWGWLRLSPASDHPALRAAWPGYRLFLAGLLLTAFGSAFYHWAPDDFRLVWDRIPIALACAGLLAAVKAETCGSGDTRREVRWLSVFAVASVVWWYAGEVRGQGDLRPYLLLQILPIVLIPLWQWAHGASRADRWWFAAALLLYVVAKVAELNDQPVLAAAHLVSGHTLKHLLATAAAGVLVGRLACRVAAGRQGAVGYPPMTVRALDAAD